MQGARNLRSRTTHHRHQSHRQRRAFCLRMRTSCMCGSMKGSYGETAIHSDLLEQTCGMLRGWVRQKVVTRTGWRGSSTGFVRPASPTCACLSEARDPMWTGKCAKTGATRRTTTVSGRCIPPSVHVPGATSVKRSLALNHPLSQCRAQLMRLLDALCHQWKHPRAR